MLLVALGIQTIGFWSINSFFRRLQAEHLTLISPELTLHIVFGNTVQKRVSELSLRSDGTGNLFYLKLVSRSSNKLITN